MHEAIIDILTTRKEIFKALTESQDANSIIGIASKDLGPGMFMTSVKEIINDGDDQLIILNSYDITGYFLEKNKIKLGNISSVIPFKAVFTNPFLRVMQTKAEQSAAEGEENNLDYIY
jgi:hypothetical protein